MSSKGSDLTKRKESVLTPRIEQETLLQELKDKIQRSAFDMRKFLEDEQTILVLIKTTEMISELRTSALSPKNYFELYSFLLNELRNVESYLDEQVKTGLSAQELYKVVQFTGQVIPRLYLLITAGSVLINTEEVPIKDILQDLNKMCRGIQHPTRGIFLRYYLTQMVKDKLPDITTQNSEMHGTVEDSINFIISNFIEMNKLWIRMQHQTPFGNLSEIGKKYVHTMLGKERTELGMLVGTNLSRLAQLEGVTVEIYSQNVLPLILHQIIDCNDKIAQEYLFVVMIQAFPDEFHLETLETLLKSLEELNPNVDIKEILQELMQRLVIYFKTNRAAENQEHKIFTTFSDSISRISQKKVLKQTDLLIILRCLLQIGFSLNLNRIDYVDYVFQSAFRLLNNEIIKQDDSNVVTQMIQEVIQSYNNVIVLIEIESFPHLTNLLPLAEQRKIANNLIENVLKSQTIIEEIEKLQRFFNLIQILLNHPINQNDLQFDSDFQKEQSALCKVIHFFYSDDIEKYFLIFQLLIKELNGTGKVRMKNYIFPLIFSGLKLAQKMRENERNKSEFSISFNQLFDSISTILENLINFFPEVAFKLFLQTAQAANKCRLEKVAYEMMLKAITIYGDVFSLRETQFKMLFSIISTLFTLNYIGNEYFSFLAVQCAIHSKKLVQPIHQAKAICCCSRFFYLQDSLIPTNSLENSQNQKRSIQFHDDKKLVGCLSKAIRIASSSIEFPVSLESLFEILDVCLIFFETQKTNINIEYINTLIELIIQVKEKNQSQPQVLFPQNSLVFINQMIRKFIKKKKGEKKEIYLEINFQKLKKTFN
ncbi:vacuolar protein sorting-associated protein [Anaeramoeba ignava]|uniref:Vacuolar protein sorting-associated protein 35 n=1 Tax=Anaeramoeba ignava TaxID=1746090 RepID=A0A9Q0RB39_ANAIG|nr:vacuolar protein sorting-associated protein [Anaeramoeba ignava]